MILVPVCPNVFLNIFGIPYGKWSVKRYKCLTYQDCGFEFFAFSSQMYFHFSKSATILFEGWAVDDATGKALLTCIYLELKLLATVFIYFIFELQFLKPSKN